jgi:amino acid permease
LGDIVNQVDCFVENFFFFDKKSRQDTYERVGYVAFGRPGAAMVGISVIGLNFGATLAYLILLGGSTFPLEMLWILINSFADFLEPLASYAFGPNSPFSDRAMILFLVTMFLLLPMSLWPQLLELSWFSLVSLLIGFFFVTTVVLRYFTYRADGQIDTSEPIELAHFDFTAFQSVGTAVFAFGIQSLLIPVTSEMKDNRFSQVAIVANIATIIPTVAYLLCGVFGYLTFRQQDNGEREFDLWKISYHQ